MKRFHLMFLAMFFSVGTIVMGQNSSNKFLVGLGTHAVDFSGSSYGLNLENWSMQAPISRAVVGYSLSPAFALDAAVSLGSVFDSRMDISKQFFTNSGVGLRYKFTNGHILKEDARFDPYLRVGANYSYYDYSKGTGDHGKWDPARPDYSGKGYSTDKNKATVSAGFGFNFWFGQAKKVGFNWQSDFNKGFGPHGYQNFLQHSAGIVFRFGGADQDHDGVPDDKDLCPTVPGPKKLNGCPDTDGDGVLDKDDMCPTVPGKAEWNGCPDTDGDGLHDGIDKCPTVAGPKENNGCPWPDQDGDGVPDKDDMCPTVPGTFSGCPDTDGDGFHDGIDQCIDVPGTVNGCPDADGDGIADKDDACPNEAGPASNHGCPEGPKNSVFFDTNKSTLTTSSKDYIKGKADIMKADSKNHVRLEGHADERGTASYNVGLSQRRAESVKRYLNQDLKVKNKITTKGLGFSKPYATGHDEAAWSKNRRVEIIIDGQK